jgi:hypothetical protein
VREVKGALPGLRRERAAGRGGVGADLGRVRGERTPEEREVSFTLICPSLPFTILQEAMPHRSPLRPSSRPSCSCPRTSHCTSPGSAAFAPILLLLSSHRTQRQSCSPPSLLLAPRLPRKATSSTCKSFARIRENVRKLEVYVKEMASGTWSLLFHLSLDVCDARIRLLLVNYM